MNGTTTTPSISGGFSCTLNALVGKGDDMDVGTFVKVKDGASAWMRERGYWINDWPESIDGMIGEITHDYTEYKGDDCHYEVALSGVEGCGIHPQWLIANTKLAGDRPAQQELKEDE